jgi:hypothetical protein
LPLARPSLFPWLPCLHGGPWLPCNIMPASLAWFPYTCMVSLPGAFTCVALRASLAWILRPARAMITNVPISAAASGTMKSRATKKSGPRLLIHHVYNSLDLCHCMTDWRMAVILMECVNIITCGRPKPSSPDLLHQLGIYLFSGTASWALGGARVPLSDPSRAPTWPSKTPLKFLPPASLYMY